MIEFLEHRIAPAIFVVTTLGDTGPGSLREAVESANDAEGPDLIIFKKGLTGSIVLAATVVSTDTLAIKGPGASKLGLKSTGGIGILRVSDGDINQDSPLTISGLFFNGGGDDDVSGGAIEASESLKVNRCVFRDNVGTSGGAINAAQGLDGVPLTADIRNSTFAQNAASVSGRGGAVSISILGSATLKNNVFNQNFANLQGGAVNANVGAGSILLVENCKFISNKALRDAGGAYLAGAGPADSTVIVRNSQFIDNHAGELGAGGVNANTAKVIFEKSTFIQNTAIREGGGLLAAAFSALAIRSCQFLDNVVGDETFAGVGGGVHLEPNEGSDIRLAKSVISGNTATGSGGGMFVEGVSAAFKLTGSAVANNFAKSNGGGIALQADASSQERVDASIAKCKFTANVAEDGLGGGMAIFGDGEILLQSSTLLQNRAGDGGGGIAFLGASPVTIVGTMISQNSAVSGGGVVSLAPLEVRACKVLGNTASFGGGIRSNGNLTVLQSVVSGNVASSGPGINDSGAGPISIIKSIVAGNFGNEIGEDIVDN